ncbi:putative sugar nucleotidyl transferase [uncultured Duncaniella sp.]|uniref:putative sugar nucleotidyl transferase n=1 Tax=uncultured Duncaniella sp. TaxID=2768039 RepID=UPI0025F11A57|nr:putative sugar nucleotidyl transferase [uncultured Duncaniella sp.]
MRNIILFDPIKARQELLPLTYTRPVAMIRFGITTMLEKWQRAIEGTYSFETQDYLSIKYPLTLSPDGDDTHIAANICPDPELVDAILALRPEESLITGDGTTIAYRGNGEGDKICYNGSPLAINRIWEIFMLNDEALRRDFTALTADRRSQQLSDSCRLIGDPANLFIEEGAVVEGAIINVAKGPVYIGRHAEIMEGACLRGPIALCEHSVINMGAKIYGATTLGPHCKVGGELNNVVMTGYSNKAHDGFLGNAVIGEWCNLGAGCTASNLKNTYGSIKLWSIAEDRFIKTGLQFCGLIMGDHSKAGINTMFNTATMVGVGVNFYGPGFPRTYLPSFTQGSTAGMHDMDMDAFFETASKVMARRDISLTEIDKEILLTLRQRLFDVS